MKDILDSFGAATFGELYADEYDERHNPGTTDAAVQLLCELAENRRTLELAIGTGRVAIPMANAGIDIQGIDGSAEMLTKLREKPGGETIKTEVADMADFQLEDSFGFVFLIFNTFYNLTSQEAQVSCIQRAADHLEPGGQLLLEMFVPQPSLWDSEIRLRDMDMNALVIEGANHDPVEQTVEFQRAVLKEGSVTMRPLAMRYACPPEIDLMAQMAGLSLESRWSDWNRSPFSGESKMHISLYSKSST